MIIISVLKFTSNKSKHNNKNKISEVVKNTRLTGTCHRYKSCAAPVIVRISAKVEYTGCVCALERQVGRSVVDKKLADN